MRATLLLIIFSCACAHIERPDAEMCVVNAPAEHVKCYNLKHDYSQSGSLKRDASPSYKKARSVHDLNKGVWMSNADWAEVKAWISELRRAYEESK